MSWYSGTSFWIGSVVQLDMSWYDKNKHLCRSMFVCVCACVLPFSLELSTFSFDSALGARRHSVFCLCLASDCRSVLTEEQSIQGEVSRCSIRVNPPQTWGATLARSLTRSAARTQMWLESQKSLDYSKIIVPGAQRRVGSVLPPSQDQMQICKSAPSSTLHAATSWKKNRIRRVKYVHTVSVRSQIRIGNLGRYLSKQSN